MPCFNEANRLPASVGSVANQTFKDFELVVIDDGSRDGTFRVMEALAVRYPFLRIFSQANKGQSAARNRGIRETRGELIAFLDADDEWHPEFLESMVAALDGDPDAGLAYCGWQNVGLPGARGEPFVPPDYEDQNKLETFMKRCRWPIHAAMTRKRLIEEAGGFDEDLAAGEDFALWLQIAPFNKLVRVPRVLAYYHHKHGGQQITEDRLRLALNHMHAQKGFLRKNPDIESRLRSSKIKEIIYGELRRCAFDAYWRRELEVAQPLFRRLLGAWYVQPGDLRYLLPALLPRCLYVMVIHSRDRK